MTTLEQRILGVALIWLAAGALLATYVVVAGAPLATGALIFAAVVAPWALAPLIGGGAPPPTIAELLYAVESRGDARR